MELKLLILCSFAVRIIFACHRVTNAAKLPKLTESTDCRFEASLVTLKAFVLSKTGLGMLRLFGLLEPFCARQGGARACNR